MANTESEPSGLRAKLAASRRRAGSTQRFSTVLRRLTESADERITLGAILAAFKDRAFGALLFILAAPNILPMPPGASSVFGAPLLLVAGQLTIGRAHLWLPAFLSERSFKTADLKRIVDAILPFLRRSERLLRPRLEFMFGPVGDRIIGLICLLLAIVIFLPIPLANMAPAWGICFLALALLQHDGIAAILGLVAAVVTGVILYLVAGALWIAATAFFGALFGGGAAPV
ncbi:MAG: exopolysaccharide biosynthesis protein [Bauldia sp.]|nr:exopolysaccharide biosynthesis protein [Bauldia sp.]